MSASALSASSHMARGWVLAAGCLVLLGGLGSPGPAQADECAKAGDAVDKALCGDPHAKAADDRMVSVDAGQMQAGVACHDATGYRVIQKDRTDGLGADFLIRRTLGPATPKPCTFSVAPGDLRLPAMPGQENAWDFLALSGDRMALDDGTAPQNRTLIVVDLSTGAIVACFKTFDTARISNSTAFVTRAGPRGTRALCPNLRRADLPMSRMISETAVDLTTLVTTPTGTVTCAVAQ